MPRMVRKQIYVESRQDTTVKKQARILGITEAEIIRRAIDHQMASVRLGARDPKARDQETVDEGQMRESHFQSETNRRRTSWLPDAHAMIVRISPTRAQGVSHPGKRKA
jgi:hypothetical protein